MGVLRHVSSGRRVVLGAHNVAGRASSCAVPLADPSASNDHASVLWTGNEWKARDLGSTNGTFLDQARIAPGESAPLARGAILRFGCDAERWALIDDHGPSVVARALDADETRTAEDGLLALPSADNVVASIVADSAGRWFIETSDGSRRPVQDAERIVVAGQTWELSVPTASPVAGTYKQGPALTLATLTLRFHVSRDEEHVSIEALHDERSLSLGERSSFYLLLVLARARLKEAAEGKLPEQEQGWFHVSDLAKALRTEEQSLNVTVFRARKVLAKAGVEDAERLVERRPRQIRIGTGRLQEIKA